ncbi:MAG: S8 family serine peptidase [Dehalococcoidia bacterium]|nr:MAG: S8 family serine peptidase [Dehalococcoidia bacterium]
MTLARLLALFAALLIVSCFSAEAQQPPALTHEDAQVVDIQPARPASSVALASGALRSAVELLERGQALGPAIDVVDSKIRVEVLHDLGSSEISAVITDLGGTVEGEVEGVLVQALVPFDRLVALESHAGVQFVRPPLEANVPILPPSGEATAPQNGGSVVGEEVAKTNADQWHSVGYTGAGVRVGIVDYFDETVWNDAQGAGEVPAAAGTFCQCDGSACNIWTVVPDAQHGTAVSEIIHEMAPGAQLYLATVCTVSDLQDAVDYFDTQGVDIISRSLTAQYDGPGDGTGPIATVIDNAVADGMVWFNSAGNNANDGSYYGSYWRGQWADANANDWLDFAPGDELMGFGCWFINGVRWSDFGAGSPTDYDVCVFDDPAGETLIDCSFNDQTTGAPPLELDLPCNPGGDAVDYLAINLWDAGNGTSGDVLEFMTNGSPVEYWQNPYSASGPASDTASPGGLSIGAVDPPLGIEIAPYSSQGPTNDGLYGGTDRMKPDISAAACVASFTYAPGCFNGTSAATPAAAGAAALIIEAGLATTPAQVKTYLLSNAAVDRGAPGPDNVFGEGELVLGSIDADGDTVPDHVDTCPETYDTGNGDYDGDGVPGSQPPPSATWGGDACDADDDNDTVLDGDDVDPLDEFACQDLDADTCDDCSVLGVADPSDDGPDNEPDGLCDDGDPDDDNDGPLDTWENGYACTDKWTADASDDDDTDGLTHAQEYAAATHPCDPDTDDDTVLDGTDTDPLDPYVCQDVDSDTCDDCSVLGVADPSQDGTDADSDGACDAGDVCTNDPDDDADNDGICVASGYLPPKTGDNDNCPADANPGQEDFEPDGIGDACDHSDGDDFVDAVELYLATDPLDDCTDEIGVHDAWPLDINMDKGVTVVGDALNFRDRIGAAPGDPEWWQRLDFNMDNDITVVGDALLFAGMIGEGCT